MANEVDVTKELLPENQLEMIDAEPVTPLTPTKSVVTETVQKQPDGTTTTSRTVTPPTDPVMTPPAQVINVPVPAVSPQSPAPITKPAWDSKKVWIFAVYGAITVVQGLGYIAVSDVNMERLFWIALTTAGGEAVIDLVRTYYSRIIPQTNISIKS